MKPYQVILTIAASAAIATLGLLWGGGAELPEAAADHPLDDHFDPLMPRYPRAAEFPLGEGLDTGGDGTMRMSYFSTEDPPLRVARFYQTVWEQEGLSVHHDVTPAGGVVGTYDPRVGMARSVTIVTQGGRTWAFPATVERPGAIGTSEELGQSDGLPVYPGSTKGLTLRTTDAGRASVVTSYTNGDGLEKNVRFYRENMIDRGWNESEVPRFEEELGGHQTLSYERGNERCSINLTPAGEGDQVIVCVVYEGNDAS